jgi:uncharacterized iron-regulated membrane protein
LQKLDSELAIGASRATRTGQTVRARGSISQARNVRRGRLWSLMFLTHEVLGVASGLIVAIACFTGAVLVFQDQIIAVMHPARTHVAISGAPLGIDAMADSVLRQNGARPEAVTIFAEAGRPAVFAMPHDVRLYVNPYNGKIADTQKGTEKFFEVTTAIHRRLLAGEIGRRIVGIATLCFVIILISGVVIWWPHTMRMLRMRLSFKHPAGWRRRNYDLHVVLGIYATVILLVVGGTGLVWSFRTVGKAVDGMTPKGKATPPPPHSVVTSGATPIPLSVAFTAAQRALGQTTMLSLYVPEKPRESIMVMGLPPNAPWRQATDIVYLDQFTGKPLRVDWFRNRPLGELLRRGTNPVHVGSLYGLPSEIAAFLACLIGTIAPITGFIIWVNRKWPRAFRRRRSVEA